MADLTGLRAAIETLATKLDTVRSVISALQEGQVVQGTIDDIQTRVEEIGDELDEIIASAQGGGTPPAGETPTETPA